MKICFLGLEMAPVGNRYVFLGGTTNNVVRLSKALRKVGHEVHIVTSDSRCKTKRNLKLSSVTVHTVPIHFNYASVPYGVEAIIRLAQETAELDKIEHFDIIDIHSGFAALSLFSLFFSKVTKAAIVFTLYSASEIFDSPIGLHGLYMFLSAFAESQFLLSNVNKIVVVSENVRKRLVARGIPEDNLVFVPPCVDFEIFNPQARKPDLRSQLGIPRSVPVILYVGSCNPYKGVKTLIQAVKTVFKKLPHARLILAIGGAEKQDRWKNDITKLVQKFEIESNVVNLSIIDDVAGLMASSDVVVVPYLTTCGITDQPMTILEAMACAKPVIATNVGGVNEIIQDGFNGILVKPGQVSELADALILILKDEALAKRIGMNAASYISHTHDVEQIARKLEIVYQSVV